MIKWIRNSRFSTRQRVTEMCSGSEAGSYLRLIDSYITQLKAQGPSAGAGQDRRSASGAGRARELPWREAGPPNHHDDKVDSDLQLQVLDRIDALQGGLDAH